MKRSQKTFFCFLVAWFLVPEIISGQISHGGQPLSIIWKSANEQVVFQEFNAPYIEPDTREKLPPKVGVTIAVSLRPENSGRWDVFPDGQGIWRLGIRVRGALGLGLYYSSFRIPEGGRLFVYTPDYSKIIGAFTQDNNTERGLFATELIPGDELILEYNGPTATVNDLMLEVNEILYAYQNLGDLRGFGDSGPCEVNVNCPEGNAWKDEKRGVAKIILKEGGSAYLCTGSLVNNVRQDSTPYFLTANHCGPDASTGDYSQWVFYFNYEAAGCENPLISPLSQTITGSTLIAKGYNNPSLGSDFKLLLLGDDLPESYNPYFNGWNRNNSSSESGVGIHHPKGDIKKISTYTEPLISSEYNSGGTSPDAMYWRVVWAETVSGHGVTEGGSSGSPIFNEQHQIAGTLTGGAASCQNTSGPDYYGKFSWHWESNGSISSTQLKPWLDPDNTGVTELEGFGYGNILSAGFYADKIAITTGDYVTFLDQSSGKPAFWDWYFEAGNPGSSTIHDSINVGYNSVGRYDVRLAISDGIFSDTLVKRDYIEVRALFYPNPAVDHFYMDLGRDRATSVILEFYDITGRMVKELHEEQSSNLYRIQLPELREGMYFVKYKVDEKEFDPEKLIILN
ncbi:MAG: T9SS type A sorting domain-containing protein [Bacteroidetes bacterium]|nr:T9SS type A sorting domain-containing protein [Bacteroidota bacterium]